MQQKPKRGLPEPLGRWKGSGGEGAWCRGVSRGLMGMCLTAIICKHLDTPYCWSHSVFYVFICLCLLLSSFPCLFWYQESTYGLALAMQCGWYHQPLLVWFLRCVLTVWLRLVLDCWARWFSCLSFPRVHSTVPDFLPLLFFLSFCFLFLLLFLSLHRELLWNLFYESSLSIGWR